MSDRLKAQAEAYRDKASGTIERARVNMNPIVGVDARQLKDFSERILEAARLWAEFGERLAEEEGKR